MFCGCIVALLDVYFGNTAIIRFLSNPINGFVLPQCYLRNLRFSHRSEAASPVTSKRTLPVNPDGRNTGVAYLVSVPSFNQPLSATSSDVKTPTSTISIRPALSVASRSRKPPVASDGKAADVTVAAVGRQAGVGIGIGLPMAKQVRVYLVGTVESRGICLRSYFYSEPAIRLA